MITLTMAEDPNIHPAWATEAKLIAKSLNQLDYFQILGVARDCTLEDLKSHYHQLQRNYHPDAFFSSPDEELKEAVHLISKRIAEAYTILRDHPKREKYVRDIDGPERASRLRFTEESEREQRKEKETRIAKTEQGRKLWAKAQNAARRGDLKGAIRDLQTALVFESGNPIFTDRIAELKSQLTP